MRALCFKDLVCDLIVGNIKGVKERFDVKQEEIGAAVTIRAQAKNVTTKKPLKTPYLQEISISKDELQRQQREANSLDVCKKSMGSLIVKKDYEVTFEEKRGWCSHTSLPFTNTCIHLSDTTVIH